MRAHHRCTVTLIVCLQVASRAAAMAEVETTTFLKKIVVLLKKELLYYWMFSFSNVRFILNTITSDI